MKYYSDVTKQLYDSEEALHVAEAKVSEVQAKEEEKKKARTARAKEVENAFKAALEAQNKYNELRNKFIEDYGSFHMSYSHKTPIRHLTDFESLIDQLFSL